MNYLQHEPSHVALPDTLYHYTSQGGFTGIISSRSLYATDIHYLNDSSEYGYGVSIIDRVINDYRKRARGRKRQFFEEFDDAADFMSIFRFCVSCLTSEGDLLGQWRGYGAGGFSIGFDSARLLENLSSIESCAVFKCLYEPDEQQVYFRSVVDAIIDGWLDRQDRPSEHEPNSIPFRVKPAFLLKIYRSLYAPMFKHPEFREEREWRIVLSKRPDEIVEFRPGTSMLIPYTKVRLANDTDDNVKPEQVRRLPLAEVVVGPTPHAQLSLEATRLFLGTQGLNASIRNSDIPFRSW